MLSVFGAANYDQIVELLSDNIGVQSAFSSVFLWTFFVNFDRTQLCQACRVILSIAHFSALISQVFNSKFGVISYFFLSKLHSEVAILVAPRQLVLQLGS